MRSPTSFDLVEERKAFHGDDLEPLKQAALGREKIESMEERKNSYHISVILPYEILIKYVEIFNLEDVSPHVTKKHYAFRTNFRRPQRLEFCIRAMYAAEMENIVDSQFTRIRRDTATPSSCWQAARQIN